MGPATPFQLDSKSPIVFSTRLLSPGMWRCLCWFAAAEARWVAVAWLLRGMFRPYVGHVHDAKLYALQVANRAWEGRLAQDLFFAFGSQDNFSVISRCMAPLANLGGVSGAMFLAYLVGMLLLLAAEARLVRLLVGPGLTGALTFLIVAAFDHPYGGRGVFFVHEPFFTARLPAQALVLWGIVLLISPTRLGLGACRRSSLPRFSPFSSCIVGLACQALAVAVHPLMGIGGLALAIGLILSRKFAPERIALGVGLSLLLLILLTAWNPNWPPASLPRISGDWESACRVVSPHCFLSAWEWEDWGPIAGALALLLGAIVTTPRSSRRALWVWTMILAMGSLTVAWVADQTMLRVLVAGQAYRGLWLPMLFAIPAGVLLARRAWLSQARVYQHMALVIVAYLLTRTIALVTWPALVILYAFAAITLEWVNKGGTRECRPHIAVVEDEIRAKRWIAAIWTCFLIGFSLTNLGLALPVVGRFPMDPLTSTWLTMRFVSPVLLAMGAIGVTYALRRLLPRRWVVASLFTLGILLNGLVFVALQTPAYSARYYPQTRSVAFVDQVTRNRNGTSTIYWPFQSSSVWLDLRANSYHEFCQVSGVVFSESMARESRRRMALIRPLEVRAMKDWVDLEPFWECVLVYLGATYNEPAPTQADLLRAAGDRQLDWIVLSYPVEGAPHVSDGRVYVYDCARLRGNSGN